MNQQVDDFILQHAKKPYDPVKAHEYYMRTRKLKGRKSGGPSYTVDRGNGKTVRLSSKQMAEQRAYAQHRVTVIKDRLQNLRSELQKKVAEAKKRELVAKRNEAEAEKGPTAAEKSESARESKKYRDKNQGKIASKRKQDAAKTSNNESSPKRADSVESLKNQISTARESLKKAVDKQRQLATATKNG